MTYINLGLLIKKFFRGEQAKFNDKFRSLTPELQRFSANQFNNLDDDILQHAFNMFITLDTETLAQVNNKELT